MNSAAFQLSIEEASPPKKSNLAIQALWHAAKGNWETAHQLAQSDKSISGAWVHAYLHRVEGDISNANYWYRRADQPKPSSSLRKEWREIAETLLLKPEK